jgi:hypothetical protein
MYIYLKLQLQDLLKPENAEIRIRECKDNGVFVSGIEWVHVSNPTECLKILSYAEKNRAVAFTR